MTATFVSRTCAFANGKTIWANNNGTNYRATVN